MQQTILTAPKMSCGHCKMAVESATSALAGVSAVSADPETKKIDVSWDESLVALEDIKQAITAAGYPAE
ncbi:MAG: cation transporter [Thermoleophilia bacterium]